MFKSWVNMLMFVPSVAAAQTGAPLALPGGGASPQQYQNDCTHLYPPAAAEIGAQGITLVSVHVTTDGVVQNPRIAETSGNTDLDKAALVCLANARVRPIKSGGAAIEADTDVQVVWQQSFFTAVPAPKAINICRGYYPPLAIRLGYEGVTTITLTIAENGSVKDPKIVESTGHDELDQAALACVSKFQYRPVTQNGRPVAVDWITKVSWRLR